MSSVAANPADLTAAVPHLLYLVDVAEAIGQSVSTTLKMHRSGRLPAPLDLPRPMRWHPATISAWLAAGCPPREVTKPAPVSPIQV